MNSYVKRTHVYHTCFSLLAIFSVLLGAIASPLAALAAPLNDVTSQPQAAAASALETADARPIEAATTASVEHPVEKAVEAPIQAPEAMPSLSPGQPDPFLLGSGSITVTKSVVGSSQSNFSVNIVGPSYPSGADVPIISGTQVITGLVNGIYTITEVSPGTSWTTTYTATTGYSTGSSAIVTLTNPITATLSGVSQITGKVFRDFNSDGQITANGTITDTGVQSVTVTAYDPNGNMVGTAQVTNASGLYTITTGGASGPYRVEFSNLPTNYEPTKHGSQSGTSVQFVNTVGGASNVNLGIAQTCDYCQSNPKLVTNRYTQGTSSAGGLSAAFISLPYAASGTTTQHTGQATASEIGATWGIAVQRSTQRAYTSALLKRQSGFGPRGEDGVYVIDYSLSTPDLIGGFDLQGVTASNGGTIDLGTVNRGGGDNSLASTTTNPSRDLAAFALVGKISFGDADIAQDGKTLWLVNLNQRTLIAVDTSQVTLSTSTPNNAPSAAVRHYDIVVGNTSAPDIAGAPTCSNGTLRPWALAFDQNKGYVGVVCDAASSSTIDAPSELVAYVLSFDPTNPTAFTTEVTIPMTYARENAWGPQTSTGFTAIPTLAWQRWKDTWPSTPELKEGSFGFVSVPQPILSDIEFMDDGSMALGFIDRFSHQHGWANYIAVSGSTTTKSAVADGDILRAQKTLSGYIVEGPDNDTAPVSNAQNESSTLLVSNSYRTNDGPGGAGEFFWGDFYYGHDAIHPEISLGGVEVVPGTDEVVNTAFDPLDFMSQGVRWLDATTGAKTDAYQVVSGTDIDDFGKGSGMGDIEALCNPAPIEIGNRVWYDIDGDGIQDAGEPGISGVQVSLQTISGTVNATTDINGNYYFTREATSGSYTTTLRPNTNYTITINSIPSGYSLTTPNAEALSGAGVSSNHAISDVRDSDAVLVSGIPTIDYTTGSPGQNNHGLDFGFTKPATGIAAITNIAPVTLGNRLWIESDNDGDASTGTVTPVVGQVVTATDGTTVYTAITDANGIYTITVPANKTYTVTTDLPAGMLDTPTLGGNTGTNPAGNNDKNHDRNGTTVVVTTTSNLSIDFGFTPSLVNLGDRLWVEGDNDGNASTGTVTPVVGQVVTATDGTTIYTAITDSNGFYTITVPANKTYTVTTDLPAGMLDTATLGGNTGTNPAGNNDKNHDRAGTTVVVTTTDNLSIDFGFWQPLSLGNLVWIDANNNGVVDGAEAGVQGVTVTLSLSGTVIATTTTDAAGHYTFTNLVEGNYIVNIPAANFLPGAPLAGYVSSSDPVSAADINNDTDDDDDGSGTVTAVSSQAISLSPNSEPTSEDGDNNSNLTVDFGFFIPVSLGNRLFYDTNNDGLDNDGSGSASGSSVGIAAALVQLYRDSNGNGSFDAGDSLLLTTTTNSAGYYTFTNLAPTTSPTSTYLVVITSSNFITGGTLAGYLSSSDISSTLNPDANLDFDDNGETIGTLGQPDGLVASRAITLTVNGEPTGENNAGNDPTDDNDSNQTIDFGFLRYDLGDLPDPTYPTLLSSNGARHLIDPLANPILGLTIDSEYDGQPSGGAGGDDVNGDDEDGVTIPLLEPNVTVTITLVYSNPTSGNVYVNGWIDFNQDGTIDAGEQIITDVVAAPGSGTLNVPILVPGSAQPGDVFARFRISSDSGLGMTGSASDGEVEDYIALVPPVDLGDLPDSYNTTKTNDGARHVIDSVTRLDGSVDDEADGVPGVNANGDNLANLNDEDGVQWPPVFLPNSSTSITVSVVTTDSAFLNAWLDWNGDGDFNDELERIVLTDTEYVSGTHVITISTPAFITDTLYARFRLTDNPGEATQPTGLAPSGEVEDYVLMSLGNMVWLDNGQGGGTSNNGILDGAEQGIPNVVVELFRDGDDPLSATPVATTTTDAAGHYIFNGLQPGDYFVHIPSENFDDPGDPLYAALSSTGAGNPNDDLDETSDENGIDDTDPELNGISSNAITLSIGDEPTDDGNGANGNLTLDFGFVTYDRGDLPNPYDTLRAVGGANHVVTPDLYFGATVDPEADGQPSDNANGDDNNGTPDDEDGIVFMTPLQAGANATISLTAHVTPGLTAYYSAFIDFNGDGDFNDLGEIITGTATNGANLINLTVPDVVSDTVYSRFRISSDASKIANTTGAAPDGEVEDYVLMSLGNQLWFDNGSGTANNGLLDSGEQPVSAGVTLTLVLSGTTTPLATTTTDASGHYTFTGLAEGDYQVIVAAENFQPAGLLAGYVGSTGQDSGDSTDNNDNGADVSNPALSGIPSNGVTLTLGSEPTNDGNGANSNLTVDFGLYKLEVGDLVWNDLNNNGQVDSGEPVLPNVSVALLDNSGTVISTTTTDGSGLYAFTWLISGTYVISVTPPAGYQSSTPTTNDDSGNNTDHGTPNGNFIVSQPFALTPGAGAGSNETNDLASGVTSNPNLDFGLWQPLELGNRVWYDTNNNGLHDGGEVGVAGVALTLLDNSGNPVTSTVTSLSITATTDANGYYTFTELISGTYKVQVDGSNFLPGAPLADYVNSDYSEANPDANADEQDNGINPVDLADYLANGVVSGAISLSAGDEPTGEEHLGATDNSTNSNYTVDFGFYKLTVGDLVWNDLNNNGQVDNGEAGLPNVPVALLDNSGNVISTTTTDSAGLYTFTGLISGTYVISVTPPASYVSSTGQESTDGNNNRDHGASSGNVVVSQPFDLTPGSEPTVNNPTGSTSNPNLDFGLWQPLELGNRAWYDADNGGDIDSGEWGLAGVTLTLLDNNDNPVISTVTGQPITTTTDAGGSYTFTNLISDTYQVRVDAANFQTGGALQAYLSSTPTEANPDSDVDSNDNGIDPASNAAYLSNGVTSGLVTLSAGNEPTNEADESLTGLPDNNSNLSVDFGFLLWDRGDLPNAASATNSPAYSTTVADGGPSHIIIPGLRIGASEDGEMDGQATATANGDDANGSATDDEDGVTLPAFSAGQDAVVTVSVVNTTGVDAYVYGFIDFNGDGDFDDSGETIDAIVPGDGSVSSVALTFTVPVDADANQLLGARFRISSDDTLTANGAAPDGEVEDYLISVKPYDLGDLPSLYPTSLTDDGTRHVISSGLYFGASVDNEGDGQSSVTALGDDNNGTPDDEDGIVFMTSLMPNQNATISLTAYVTPGLTAYYGALIDFNGDGLFSASEIFTGTIVNGQNTLSLTVPGIVSDTVYSRFRLSSDPTSVGSPTGEAPDGEVEDYALLSVGNQLWLDSAAYTANDGEFDLFEQPVPAGVTVTLVVSGTSTPIATTTTDADGKYLFTGLPAGDYQVIVAAANFQPGGLLEGYASSTGQESGDSTDYNDNGADVANPAATGIPSNGFSLALGDEPSDDGNDSNSNLTIDFGLVAYDWGDLPDGNAANSPSYATLSNNIGASHLIIDGLHMGTSEDGELDGQPTASADGDDSNGMATDDEDGVILPRFIPGQSATVVVNVVNTTIADATVYGFIDFNGNGILDDNGEVASGTVSGSGQMLLTFNVPSDADTTQWLGARFRLGLEGAINLDSPIGDVDSGEVEDYLIQMQPILGAIGNYVWLDENADGQQDAGEPGLPNVIVTMLDGQGNSYTTTTDSQGGYLFPDLPKGFYIVSIARENFDPGGALEGMEQTPLFGADEDFGNKDEFGYLIDLDWGEENLTADFGYNPLPSKDVNNGDGLAALGDRVWIDSDGDGVQDPNEIPVSGVVLTLYVDLDGNGIYETAIATDTTDANGNYLFDDLLPGAYVVKVTDSSNASHDVLSTPKYTQTGDPDHFATSGTSNDNMSTVPVVLAPGDLFLNVDFGYQPQTAAGLNSVGDTIWFDADADGNGMAQAPVDGGTSVTQGAGGTADATDYGIAGVTVALVQDTNGNGVIDAGEPIIATDVTDSKGQYLFAGLADGKYIVKVTDTDNVLQGLKPTWDKDDGLVSPDEMSAVDLDSAHAIAASVNDRLQDFGYTSESQQPGMGKVGDTIWFDSNRDGAQNPNESGIEGVLVILTEPSGVTQTTVTDENGHYTFGGLPLNQIYTVTVAPDNFAPGGVLEGMENTGDKEQDKNNTTTSELLTSSAPVDLTNDLGYAADDSNPIGRVGNLLWLDSNADGFWDGANGPDGIAGNDDDEPLIGGVTLDLYRDLNGNGVIDAGEPRIASTTTTSTPVTTSGDLGNYLFDNLPVVGNGDGDADAEYVVDVTDVNGVLTGYWHSLGIADISDFSQADPDAVEISEISPENLTADFGYYIEPAAVGNYVWVDSNANGVQDDGESGINGVIVTLVIDYPNGDKVTLAAMTGNDNSGNPGYYSFGNLLLDEDENGSGALEAMYTISVDSNQLPLTGYVATLVDQAGNDKLDSDDHSGVLATPIQGLTDTKAQDPASNEGQIASYDFGYYQLASLGNYVWLDENADGQQDAGEPGLPNVVVVATNDKGNVFTTTTDSQGGYLFSDLMPGIYTVTIPASNFAVNGTLEGMEQTPLTGGNDSPDFGNKDDAGYTVELSSGEENLTADFGYNPLPSTNVNNNDGLAALGDRVWIDSDGDGVQDPNETPVQGVVLTLYTDPDGNGIFDTLIATDTTNANGYYLFTDLPAGAYVVKVTDSSAASHDVLNTSKYTQTGDPDHFATSGTNNDNLSTSPVVLAPGDLFLNVDFGYQPLPAAGLNSVGDTIWFDADADGNGPAQPAVDGGATVTQGAGGTADAAEYGIAGVTVALIHDIDGDGLFDAGEPIVATDVTDGKGQYLFAGLADGKYIVQVTDSDHVLDGLKPTWDKDDLLLAPDEMSAVDLDSAGANATGVHDRLQDFGYTPLANDGLSGLIGDTIWFDSNRDGMQNPTEPGIEGVVVIMTDMAGNPLASTTTNENGHYYFSNLPLNEQYKVVVAPENFAPGGVLEGMENTGDKEQDKNNTTTSELLTSSAPIDLTNDLGYAADDSNPIGRVGNLVWLDSNADGLWDQDGADNLLGSDDDEPLIGGVTLDLYRDLNGNGKVDAGEPRIASTTTTSTPVTTSGDLGNYLFDNLPVIGNGDGDAAAEYVVDVTDVNGVLAGYWHSLGTVGSTNNSQADPYGVEISTTKPENLTADFGYYVEPAAVGNYVWVDTNGDGIQNDGETGLNGVEVTLKILYPDGTTITVTTVTTDDTSGNPGWYSFGNLLIDEDQNGDNLGSEPVHTLSVDLTQAALAGYKSTLLDQGGNDKLDADNPTGVTAKPVQGQTDTHAIDPASNEPPIASYDFGFYEPASLGDRVWFDSDRDGVQDDGEVGVSGVKVELLDKNGTVTSTTFTDASGIYTFAELLPGVYSVRFTPPAGYAISPANQGDDTLDSDANPTTGQTISTTLVSGENDPTWDAGLYAVVNLGNLVWHDANNDGLFNNGEKGIEGVTLQLFQAGDDPTTATPLLTTTTDVSGTYQFTNLLPGKYFVYIPTPPVAYPVSSTPTDSADNGEDNDDNGSQSALGQPVISPIIDLSPNGEPSNDGDGKNGDLTLDFGFFAPASLGDLVWFDTDKDGVQDSIETGTPGSTDAIGVASVLVTLFKADGTQVATTTTDIHGYYRFDNLLPGDYYVEFTPPAGYKISPTDTVTATDVYDSDGLRTPVTNLTSGEHDPTLDLGLYLDTLPASIGDTVWLDSDKDGVQDAGESGIPGIKVILFTADGTPVASALTDLNGHYFFGSLVPGDYYVQFVAPNGLTPSPQDAGSNDGLDSDADPATGKTIVTTLDPGENDPTWDAGFFSQNPLASLGDKVWYDLDADGIQDANETGVPGVVVKLYDGTGQLLATTTTDVQGIYGFNNLLPGDYYVEFAPIKGYIFSPQDKGQDDGKDSDADPFTHRTETTTLTAGENDPTWDAGIYVPGVRGVVQLPVSLGDRVWEDQNRDGIQDANEPGIPGVTVKLYTDQGELIAWTVTDANGFYHFDNLPPGSYYVEFVPPAEYQMSPTKVATGTDINDSDMDHGTGRSPIVDLPSGTTNPNLDAGLYKIPTGDEEVDEPESSKRVFLPVISR